MITETEKEILSQKNLIDKIVNTYFKGNKLNFPSIDKEKYKEVKFIASGSSYNAARLGHKFFEENYDIIANFEYSSEFISNPNRKIKNDTLYVFVSQSGKTYDTGYALDIVKKEGGNTFSFVNNSNSKIYNEADYKVDVMAGVENSIAATKSFSACVICLWLFSKYFSCENSNILNELTEAKKAINDIFSMENEILKGANFLAKQKSVSIIGYGTGYILAKETALKIKETSYIHSCAYPTGEFLHGHSAILNEHKALIEIFTSDMKNFEKNTLLKIKKDFNPEILSITDFDTNELSIKFPKYNYAISKICAICVILQLLALKTALISGENVDKPKGLNKVVT